MVGGGEEERDDARDAVSDPDSEDDTVSLYSENQEGNREAGAPLGR